MFIRQLLGALCALVCAGQSDAAATRSVAPVTPAGEARSLTPLQSSLTPWRLGAVMGADGTYYVVSSDSSGSDVIDKVTGEGSITALHTFSPLDASGHNADGSRSGRLRFNADGNLYGVASEGGAYGFGTLFTLTTSGEFTTLLPFNFGGQSLSLDPEFNDVVQGADGAYYGIIQVANASPQYYKVSADGAFSSLCTLPLLSSTRPIQLIAAADGNLYGLMGQNIGSEVIRLTPSCGMTQLYAVAPSSSAQLWDMVLATDGNLYVAQAMDGSKIIKLTTSGVASDFYVFAFDSVEYYFPGSWSCVYPQWPRFCTWTPPVGWKQVPTSINVTGGFPSTLIQGRDGNIYGTTYTQGLHSFGTIFRLTLDGSSSTLFATDSTPTFSGLMQDVGGNITYFVGSTFLATSLAKLGSSTSLTTSISFSLRNVNLWEPTVLSWSSTGAQSCSLITDIPGLSASKSVAVSGSQTVRLYSKGGRTPAQYTAGIECTAADGSISNASTNVTIN